MEIIVIQLALAPETIDSAELAGGVWSNSIGSGSTRVTGASGPIDALPPKASLGTTAVDAVRLLRARLKTAWHRSLICDFRLWHFQTTRSPGNARDRRPICSDSIARNVDIRQRQSRRYSL